MSTTVTVREYARLTTSHVEQPTLDFAQISTSAFEWLCELNAGFSQGGAALIQLQDRRCLKIDNYVGAVETPCGTRLEILPKHFKQGDCIQRSRILLQSMIQASLKLPTREAGPTSVQVFDAPLTEWVIARFLDALYHLIKRGIRFDYQRIEEEQSFLRGQLNTARQVRQQPARLHHFQIRHDVFLPDIPENRLLKAALEIVCKTTQDPDSWRLSHELRTMLLEVSCSRDTAQDLIRWRKDRLMAHYQAVKPWIELIIQRQAPLAVAGAWHGMSLLFPMERLFESYVAFCLRDTLRPGATLRTQVTEEYLCVHRDRQAFQLRPDLVAELRGKRWVMDTKWKLLDGGLPGKHYGISQADIYQMFAYGHKYLEGKGDLMLIYPRQVGFQEALPVFEYGSGLRLWVVPFDLELGKLISGSTIDVPFEVGR